MSGKNVAIITMHSVPNLGSALQTVATSEFIRHLGYNPVIVDYEFPNAYHKKLYTGNNCTRKNESWLYLHLNGLCNRLIKNNPQKRIDQFNSFLESYLTFSKHYPSEDSLISDPVQADIYVTGSDQVWNPRWIGQDLTFFLNWVRNDAPRISYASSFGSKKLPPEYLNYISPCLQKFDAISERERTENLDRINLKGTVALDPTLLLNKGQWADYFDVRRITKQKYILCYLINYSHDPFPYAYKVIKFIQRKFGYKVVMLHADPINILRGYKVINDCGPQDFLNLLYNASFVITSSFHGTAFSLNFGIPFLTITDRQQSNDNRQVSLLNEVGLYNKGLVYPDMPLSEIDIPEEGFQLKSKLETVREASMNFLKDSLSRAINQSNSIK